MSMICKFLHYCSFIVSPPDRPKYSLGMYIQAENVEHATICLQDYFQRHSMTAEITYIQTVYGFLIATDDQYPKSKLNEQSIRPFDEALDLP